jgi:DNA-binding NtrC family response regulator
MSSPRAEEEDRTARPATGSDDPGGELEIAVVSGEAMIAYRLPATGALTIGRSPRADISLDDAAISRAHARLLVGARVEVEDLGSANGTWMRGLRLEPRARVTLGLGEALRVGKHSLLLRAVQPRTEIGPRAAADVEADPIVASEAMRRLHALVGQVALGDIAVLVLGETGAGKELTARLVHARSRRAHGPFVTVNCPAISESLLESELFGHDRGAFTGAHAAKAGLLESAHGGTVFLDEVGELPLALQAKLLRVLEDRQVTRVGASSARRIDVRFVAATNRDLEREVAEGRFRRDLFYRLDGARLSVPPLRERPDDVEPLARFFLREAAARSGRPAVTLGAAALAQLRAHPWPGNVRELRNAIGRAALVCGAGPISPDHLPLSPPAPSVLPPPPPLPEREMEGPVTMRPPDVAPLRGAMRELERERILSALAACAGNQTKAARALGISRRALVDKLTHHDIPRPRKA